jgi:hypothetical protein
VRSWVLASGEPLGGQAGSYGLQRHEHGLTAKLTANRANSCYSLATSADQYELSSCIDGWRRTALDSRGRVRGSPVIPRLNPRLSVGVAAVGEEAAGLPAQGAPSGTGADSAGRLAPRPTPREAGVWSASFAPNAFGTPDPGRVDGDLGFASPWTTTIRGVLAVAFHGLPPPGRP